MFILCESEHKLHILFDKCCNQRTNLNGLNL